ncbi:MAG: hypothetical protein AB7S26_11915 [Sandaracinaceae bacterium]
MRHLRWLSAITLVLAACDGRDPPSDGGRDAGPIGRDAGQAVDAGSFDAGSFDAASGSDAGELPSCDRTLSPSDDLIAEVTGAADGTTLCLADGDYGSVDFDGIDRTGYVTLRSETGRGATLNPRITGSSFFRFSSLTIAGATIRSCAHDVQLTGSVFTDGLLVTMRDSSCPPDLHLLVDRNEFGDLGPALYEGRISVADDDGPQPAMGLTIRNNVIGPGCQSDGIQLAGGASGVTIGPGNVFDGIVQSGPVHCDMIQFYGSGQGNTIVGNHFRDGSVALTHHTSAPDGTVFRDNLVTRVNQLQIGQSADVVFEHNTLIDLTDVFHINSDTTNASIRSNLLAANTSPLNTSVGGGCAGCTIANNLCESGACPGTGSVTATPVFVGGASPSDRAGYRLTATSPGHAAAHDGADIGIVSP